jgi:hypothetical protein
MNSTLSTSCYDASTKIFDVGSGGASMQAGVYYFTEMRVRSGGLLSLMGPVTIYLTGPMTISGGGVVNPGANPDNLRIYCTTTGDITFQGSPDFYGHIYAPNARSVSLSGNVDVRGTVVCGGQINLSGDVTFRSSYGLGGLIGSGLVSVDQILP